MRVLALVPNTLGSSPGQRYRIEQWAPYLSELGIEMEFSPFATGALEQLLYQSGRFMRKTGAILSAGLRQYRRMERLGEFDLVYLFREASLIGPGVLERIVARRGIPIVFDFDDAVFVPYKSPSNGYLSYLKFPGKTATFCRAAREVMAGNEYLASFARRHNTNVSIVPTTIDTDVYRPRTREPRDGRDRPLHIGWTGSHSTSAHLRCALGHLAELGRVRRFKLIVIGADAPDVPGVEVEARPWRAETELEDLRQIDIGIMPLPDDEWTRGKCGLKALQCMALGIPTVVSPVGVNVEIVKDGENGFVAGPEGEWVEKLQRLLDDRDLRAELGRAGRETVVRQYSARAVYPRVAEIFQRAGASNPASETALGSFSAVDASESESKLTVARRR